MKRKLNNKAEGYITVCVLAIVISMLISVTIYFVATVGMIKKQREDTKRVLDSVVMESAVEAYESVKYGSDEFDNYNNDYFVQRLCDFCSLADEGEKLYSYSGEGTLKYYISVPELRSDSDSLKATLEYTVFVPIYFNGIRITTAIIPTTINSYFNEKF